MPAPSRSDDGSISGLPTVTTGGDALRVSAVKWDRKMKGGAHSHLLWCSDEELYVVKFLNNPQNSRVLVAEYLGTRLAALLGLPVPDCAFVEVSEGLIEKTPELTVADADGDYVPCLPGTQFGSKFVGGLMPGRSTDYLPEGLLAEVRNLQDFKGMLVFDKWTCNGDGRQAVFDKRPRQRRYKATFIDQGFCFGAGSWKFKDVPLRGVYVRNVPYTGVSGWESFEPWLSRLRMLEAQTVWEIARVIPPVWYGGVVSEMEELVERLLRWRARVPDLIESFRLSSRTPFPKWASVSALARPAL